MSSYSVFDDCERQATQFLKANKVAYAPHLYAYEEHGGTRVSARELGVAEHCVVKTLIFEDENGKPLMWARRKT